MDAWITWISDLIHTHSMWAIPIVGIIAFGESLAVVGLLIPATAILLLIGGLIGSGVLDPWSVLTATIIGAVLGDAVSCDTATAKSTRRRQEAQDGHFHR